MVSPDLPPSAAWRHEESRDGFESVFVARTATARTLEGHTAAVEGEQAWAVSYAIAVDDSWVTRAARVASWTVAGHREVRLEGDGAGRWRVDGDPVAELDGCLDVDLESSACTNTFPVHRLHLAIGESSEAPAAYVRALDLRVERLEQRYTRIDDDGRNQQYDYSAPVFGFAARLVYDPAGLVIDYPGIARRVL
jgi:uncharacterized protein